MGLPLYVAPVESDVRARPAPKSPATHSRSAIRRVRPRFESLGYNETRHHLEAELDRIRSRASPEDLAIHFSSSAAGGTGNSSGAVSGSAAGGPARDPTPAALRPSRGSQSTSARPRNLQDAIAARRSGGLDERTLAIMGERWANLHTGANPNPRDESPFSDYERTYERFRPRRLHRGLSATTRAGRVSRTPSAQEGSSAPVENGPRYPQSPLRGGPLRRRIYVGGPYGSSETPVSSRTPPFVPMTTVQPPIRVDGLGDRNRSLSPEGDGVWDTLLTTLTPDPQPPSVGSSFASATASASASNSQQTTAAGSSSTSLTGRDTPEEVMPPEQNCESGCEGSDTEGDEDEDEDGEQNTLTRFPTSLRNRRSYADAAGRTNSNSNNSSSGEDPLDFLEDMQRIVRHFARREDIPDEWWAEAGLSRTLSREASN